MVTKQVNSALYSLNFFCHITTFELRKRLVSALARSHLDYCSTVYSNISGDLKLQLQKLQNKCVRYVTGLRRDEHVTPARRQLGWLTTDMRRMYFAAIIIYKARRIGQPSYLAEFGRCIDFGRGDAIPELEIPSRPSDTGMKSLVYECSQFWNNLPNDIRNIPSLARFKTALYEQLFNIDTQ